MPAKGRRNRRERERERRRSRTGVADRGGEQDSDEIADAPPVTRLTAPAPVEGPSPFARSTGFLIALITFCGAAVMIYDGFSGDYKGIDQSARVIGGGFMLGVALLVAALLLFPMQIRDYFQRRRSRGM